MNYETDLSAQQDASQKNLWISGQNVDPFRAQDHQSPPQSGQKETRRLRLPKSCRLLKKGEFFRVSKKGKRLVGRHLCIDYRPAKESRLGISASCRYGSAPERNRFKRLVREAYRHLREELPPFELNVIPRQCAKSARFGDIHKEILTLLQNEVHHPSIAQ